MQRKEINEQSPLRILEESSHGGLGRGNLGVVMARAGENKTAFLVHIALDDLMRDRKVLHVSLEAPMDHVQSWYDAVFQDLSRQTHMDDFAATAELVKRNRMIRSYSRHGHASGSAFQLDELLRSLALLKQHAGFAPDVIIIDGLDWEHLSPDEVRGLAVP